MLKALSIKNFALIDQLDIDFKNQLSVITGETGSGKSILLGALGLALGNRADVSAIKDLEKKCVIEVVFTISKFQLKSFFEANDIDFETETTIRREILPSGKSRAFINDTPVNLSVLNELGVQLIDIHSQNQTLALGEADFQFQIIDSIAQSQALIDSYTAHLKSYQQLKKSLVQLEALKEQYAKDYDYNLYLYEELAVANLKEGNQETWEQELEALSHTEIIKDAFDKILSLSNHEEIGVVHSLREIKNSALKIQSFSPLYQEISDRIQSLLVEYDDVLREVEMATESVIDDPERLLEVNQNLQNLYGLQQKHKVQTITELLKIQRDLDEKVGESASSEGRLEQLKKEIDQKQEVLLQLGIEIEEKRKSIIPVFEAQVMQQLARLGMIDAQLKVDLQRTDTFYTNGINQISFQFSANKGSSLGNIKKVASGGELSRIMLVVKSILSQHVQLPTLVFDEIDTGVSGDIANKMGEIMQEMSQYMQLITITHLPQVAAKGHHHYKVYKSTTNNETNTGLRILQPNERLQEIAEMLSGKDFTESALIHAKTLLH